MLDMECWEYLTIKTTQKEAQMKMDMKMMIWLDPDAMHLMVDVLSNDMNVAIL